MKETYKVSTPQRIVFGDPLYFSEMPSKEIERLTLDISPNPMFMTKVVLAEDHDKESDMTALRMSIYMAPHATLSTYLKDMYYESQKIDTKQIGVDSAEYYLRINDQDINISTGADGYWGEMRSFSHHRAGKEHLDAQIVDIYMPEGETFDSMRKLMRYLFTDIDQAQKEITPDHENGEDEEESFEPSM